MMFRVMLGLSVGVSAASAASTFAEDVVIGSTHTCPGGNFNCEGASDKSGEPCCAFSPGSYGCCSGGAIEQCCSDDTGGVCCLSQPTVCVAKSTTMPYPSRCCPRQTVGCSSGTVGCCDPARAWNRGPPINPPTPAHAVLPRRPSTHPQTTTAVPLSTAVQQQQQQRDYTPSATHPDVAYVLSVGGLESVLTSNHVNISSGVVLQKVPIPNYNNWGEATRDFAYDATRNMFYALDVNFTATGAERPR